MRIEGYVFFVGTGTVGARTIKKLGVPHSDTPV